MTTLILKQLPEKKTRTSLQKHEKSPSYFLTLLQRCIEDFQEHFVIAVHQDNYQRTLKELMLDTKLEECICMDMDFAENYEIVHKIEIQSEHWSHQQVTLYVVITHHRDKERLITGTNICFR